MSNELTGAIAFQNQIASSKGMRAALHAALTDGILDGCALTYSGGLSCSIAAGFLMIGGGVAHNPSSMTLNFSQSSGYARIIANVDLSKTATESDFKQAFFSVDYSATVGGFGALTKSDINMSGQVYQYSFAIIHIGTGIEAAPVAAESAGGLRHPKLLWSGAAATGNITVTGIDDYAAIDILSVDGAYARVNVAGLMVGGCNFVWSDGYLASWGFRITRAGDTLTIAYSVYRTLSTGTTGNVSISKIYGVVRADEV